MSFLVGLLGGGKSQAKQSPAVSGLQLQSSAQGKAVIVTYGTTRVAPNMLWYGDFVATQVQSSAGGGGKGGVTGGGGGKGGGGGSGSYNYATAVAMSLGEGQLVGVGQVYVDKNIKTLAELGLSLFNGSLGQAAWGYLTTNHPTQALGYNRTAYVAASSYQLGNSAQLPNNNFEVQGIFSNQAAQEVIGEQDTIPASPYQLTVEYAAHFIVDRGVIDQAGNVYTAVSSAPGNQQYKVAAGVYTFSPLNVGVIVNINYSASVGPDADPSLVVADILSNPYYGAGFPASRIGSLVAYQNYCLATGLMISPSYDTQGQVASVLTDIATATNSNWVWSQGQLTLVPYGDKTISGNGKTFQPPQQPLFSLDDDDFERQSNGAGGASAASNDDPILLTRKRQSDAFNSIKLEWLDRNHSYNPAIIEAKDQAMINTYGLRQDAARQFHMFANGNAARLSVQLQLQRQAIRNIYSFQLDQRYIVLDPMDLVAITDTRLGLNAQWVRITEITENDDYTISVTAEEYLGGTGNAPVYSYQSGTSAFSADYNASPASPNVPVIWEPPVQVAFTGGLEVDLAVSGNSFWGGCQVWISSDGTNYKYGGTITGSARQGILNTPLPVGMDPDTVNTLSVNLSESNGELLSGTQADADDYHTLCYVDGEMISYETATLVTTNNYNLTYLRRGVYGTPISSHAAGAQFARVDGGVFSYPYNRSNVGQTLYIKLLSFNIYGGGLQTLSDVTPYTHVITGPPLSDAPQNFQVTQSGNAVAFSWLDLINDVGLLGYDIAYGDVGSSWDQKELLTEAARGTEMTNAEVKPGDWEFSIRGHDIAGNLGAESKVEFNVANPNALLIDAAQEPDWLGTVSGFVRHPSGVLVPDNLYTPSHYSDYTPFDQMVPDPVSSAYYITPTFDIGKNLNTRIYDSQSATLGPDDSGASATLQFAIDTWLTGETDPNSFTNWSLAYVNMRYIKAKLTYSGISAGNVSFINDFTLFGDLAANVQQSGTLVVAPGGTVLTFPNPYNSAPYVTATPVASTALYASVVSPTGDQCTIHVWDHTGSDVGGTVNWNAIGA